MRYKAARPALLGLLFALSIVLNLVEAGFSGLVPIPGIKLGHSNVVTMYCLFCMGKREAFLLAGLKAFFVLLTRGLVGACLSLSGGLLSVAMMLLLKKLGRNRLSHTFLSISGGVSHNVGQISVAALILESSAVFYYLPVLMISGVGMGLLTGILLRQLLPHLNRIFF